MYRAAFLIVLVAASSSGADVNPRSKAKVGDWAEYAYVDSKPRVFIGQPEEWKEDRRLLLKVTAVTETEITIEQRFKVTTTYKDDNGKQVVEEELDKTSIDVTRKTNVPLDLPKEHLLPTEGEDALTKTGEGAEELEIAGKKYKARWITFTVKIGPDRTESWKIWYDPEGGAFPELKTVCDFGLGERFGIQTVTLVARGNKPVETEKK